MISLFDKKRNRTFNRVVSSFIAVTFILSSVVPPNRSYAQLIPEGGVMLPPVGSMLNLTKGFEPTLIKGITLYPDNPLKFDFIVDTGNTGMKDENLRKEANKLIKYFLATLTVPQKDLWVNLSPYEKDRIIPTGFGKTEMGRDLLAQDYLLKQLTASLMYPEKDLGKEFWNRVHKKAMEKFGTYDIPMNTFNKIWIIPEKSVVYEHDNSAFVIYSHLKVMLEEDYVALEKNMGNTSFGLDSMPDAKAKETSAIQSAVVKEVLIPEIEKEVNEGKTFANLRQIFNSLILAAWYKKNLKESLLGQVYMDQNKTAGVDFKDKTANQKIYDQYLQAFQKGVYNYIKDDYDPKTQEVTPRKYFSGGADATAVDRSITSINDKAMLDEKVLAEVVTTLTGKAIRKGSVRITDLVAQLQAAAAGAISDDKSYTMKVTLVEEKEKADGTGTNAPAVAVAEAAAVLTQPRYFSGWQFSKPYLPLEEDPDSAMLTALERVRGLKSLGYFERTSPNWPWTDEEIAHLISEEVDFSASDLQNKLSMKLRDAWASVHDTPNYVISGGVMDGMSASAAAEAGAKFIYLSGWQASHHWGNPDLAKYPLDTVPNKIAEIYKYLQNRHETQQIQFKTTLAKLNAIFDQYFAEIKDANESDLNEINAKYLKKLIAAAKFDVDIYVNDSRANADDYFGAIFEAILKEISSKRNEFFGQQDSQSKRNEIREAARLALKEHLVDYLIPVFADGDAGHQSVSELVRLFIKANAASIHLEDQMHGEKKCGHMAGKVLVSVREHYRRLLEAQATALKHGSLLAIIARTDAQAAKLLASNEDPRDHYFIRGTTKKNIPTLAYVIRLSRREVDEFDNRANNEGIIQEMKSVMPGLNETEIRDILSKKTPEDLVEELRGNFPQLASAIEKIWQIRGEVKGKRLEHNVLLHDKNSGEAVGYVDEIWQAREAIQFGESVLKLNTIVTIADGTEMTIQDVINRRPQNIDLELKVMEDLTNMWNDVVDLKTYAQAIAQEIMTSQNGHFEGMRDADRTKARDLWNNATDPLKNTLSLEQMKALAKGMGIVIDWDWEPARTYEGFYQIDSKLGETNAAMRLRVFARIATSVWKESDKPKRKQSIKLIENINADPRARGVYFSENISPSFNWSNPESWDDILNANEIALIKKLQGTKGFDIRDPKTWHILDLSLAETAATQADTTNPETWGEHAKAVKVMMNAIDTFSSDIAAGGNDLQFVTIFQDHTSTRAMASSFGELLARGAGGFVRHVQQQEQAEARRFVTHQKYAGVPRIGALDNTFVRGSSATGAAGKGSTEHGFAAPAKPKDSAMLAKDFADAVAVDPQFIDALKSQLGVAQLTAAQIAEIPVFLSVLFQAADSNQLMVLVGNADGTKSHPAILSQHLDHYLRIYSPASSTPYLTTWARLTASHLKNSNDYRADISIRPFMQELRSESGANAAMLGNAQKVVLADVYDHGVKVDMSRYTDDKTGVANKSARWMMAHMMELFYKRIVGARDAREARYAAMDLGLYKPGVADLDPNQEVTDVYGEKTLTIKEIQELKNSVEGELSPELDQSGAIITGSWTKQMAMSALSGQKMDPKIRALYYTVLDNLIKELPAAFVEQLKTVTLKYNNGQGRKATLAEKKDYIIRKLKAVKARMEATPDGEAVKPVRLFADLQDAVITHGAGKFEGPQNIADILSGRLTEYTVEKSAPDGTKTSKTYRVPPKGKRPAVTIRTADFEMDSRHLTYEIDGKTVSIPEPISSLVLGLNQLAESLKNGDSDGLQALVIPKLETLEEVDIYLGMIVEFQKQHGIKQHIPVVLMNETDESATLLKVMVWKGRKNIKLLNVGRWDKGASNMRRAWFTSKRVFGDLAKVGMNLLGPDTYVRQNSATAKAVGAKEEGGMVVTMPSDGFQDEVVDVNALTNITLDRMYEWLLGYDYGWIASPSFAALVQFIYQLPRELSVENDERPYDQQFFDDLYAFPEVPLTREGLKQELYEQITYQAGYRNTGAAIAIYNRGNSGKNMFDGATALKNNYKLWQVLEKYRRGEALAFDDTKETITPKVIEILINEILTETMAIYKKFWADRTAAELEIALMLNHELMNSKHMILYVKPVMDLVIDEQDPAVAKQKVQAWIKAYNARMDAVYEKVKVSAARPDLTSFIINPGPFAGKRIEDIEDQLGDKAMLSVDQKIAQAKKILARQDDAALEDLNDSLMVIHDTLKSLRRSFKDIEVRKTVAVVSEKTEELVREETGLKNKIDQTEEIVTALIDLLMVKPGSWQRSKVSLDQEDLNRIKDRFDSQSDNTVQMKRDHFILQAGLNAWNFKLSTFNSVKDQDTGLPAIEMLLPRDKENFLKRGENIKALIAEAKALLFSTADESTDAAMTAQEVYGILQPLLAKGPDGVAALKALYNMAKDIKTSFDTTPDEVSNLVTDTGLVSDGAIKPELKEIVSAMIILHVQKDRFDHHETIGLNAPDAAMAANAPVVRKTPVGGINLDPALLDLQIKRDANGVPLPIFQQPLKDFKIDGFLPVIINVTPITNLPLLLGIAIPKDGVPVDVGYDTEKNPGEAAQRRFGVDRERKPLELSSVN